MYDLRLTPEAEAVYAGYAAAHDVSVDEFLNHTLPAMMPDGGYVNAAGEYVPTPEEQKLIQEGLDDIEAGRTVTLDEAFANARREYMPTAKEIEMINVGLDSLKHHRGIPVEESFARLETKFFGAPLK